MLISQSLIKDTLPLDVCPRFIHFRYIQRIKTQPSDAMFKGLYFEWHLLGTVRDATEPIYERLKGGGKPEVQLQLDSIIFKAEQVMIRAGIDIARGEKQLHIETDTLEGHLDLVTNDFQKPGGKAIYDVKYTDTKIDDRYNGWGDAENASAVRLQAMHYVILYHQKYGVYLPFYYLVFGKSGWVRFIRIRISDEAPILQHMGTIEYVVRKLTDMGANGWKATPEFNKCTACQFNAICDSKAMIPKVEMIVY